MEKYVIPESEKYTLDRKIEVSDVYGVEHYGSWEIHRMANEEVRNITLTLLMEENPDWDWDYWVEQIK